MKTRTELSTENEALRRQISSLQQLTSRLQSDLEIFRELSQALAESLEQKTQVLTVVCDIAEDQQLTEIVQLITTSDYGGE